MADEAKTEPETKSKTLEQYEADYKENPSKVLRQVNLVYARKLLNKPKMTWVEYCDLKIKTWTEHWTLKKKNPDAGKKAMTIKPENLEREEAKLARLQAAIATAKAKKAAEAKK